MAKSSELQELKYLEEEINAGLSIYDFEPLIPKWYESLDAEKQDELLILGFDPEDYYDFLSDKKYEPFYKIFENYGHHNIYDLQVHNEYFGTGSAALTKRNATLLKKQWLVNFSKSDFAICQDGFSVGLALEEREGKLTNRKYKEEKYGWNFAYKWGTIHSNDLPKILRSYGEKVNLFVANCVQFYNDGDQEYQVMFLGEYVKRTYCITYSYGTFAIEIYNKGSIKEIVFDELTEAVDFIQNYKYKYKIYGFKKSK